MCDPIESCPPKHFFTIQWNNLKFYLDFILIYLTLIFIKFGSIFFNLVIKFVEENRNKNLQIGSCCKGRCVTCSAHVEFVLNYYINFFGILADSELITYPFNSLFAFLFQSGRDCQGFYEKVWWVIIGWTLISETVICVQTNSILQNRYKIYTYIKFI